MSQSCYDDLCGRFFLASAGYETEAVELELDFVALNQRLDAMMAEHWRNVGLQIDLDRRMARLDRRLAAALA